MVSTAPPGGHRIPVPSLDSEMTFMSWFRLLRHLLVATPYLLSTILLGLIFKDRGRMEKGETFSELHIISFFQIIFLYDSRVDQWTNSKGKSAFSFFSHPQNTTSHNWHYDQRFTFWIKYLRSKYLLTTAWIQRTTWMDVGKRPQGCWRDENLRVNCPPLLRLKRSMDGWQINGCIND